MKLLKKLSCLVITLLVSICIFATSTNDVKAADTEGKLYIHYYRHDKTYEGWHIWVWPEKSGGSWREFDTTDDFGPTVTVPLSELTNKKIELVSLL